ncbi:MAG: hypothetical protein LBR60_08505 [Fibrobacter sp.]|jgi:hypothetical protein|nr:hypothetical protein [Fibrobacter sp.]
MKHIAFIFGYLLFLAVLAGIWWMFRTSTAVLYPSAQPLSVFQDSIEGGSSRATFSENDSLLSIDILARSGSASPYAGVKLALVPEAKQAFGNWLNLSRYDSLSIEVATRRMPQVLLTILTSDPERASSWLDPFGPRFVQHTVKTGRNFQKTTVALSDFRVPEWWFSFHQIRTPDEFTYLERAFGFLVLNGFGTMLGIPDEIQVKKIEVFGVNRRLGSFLLVIALAGSFIFIVTAYRNVRRPHDKPKEK